MSDIEEKYLMNNLVGDYQKLTQDIIMYENDLESRDRKWKEIGGIKNPNFDSDRKRDFIDEKITNLKEQRNRIWNFLSVQFNANTQIRNSNYKQLQKLVSDISKISNQIKIRKEKIGNEKGLLGKTIRHHEINVYQNSKDKEMIYLHSLGLVTLIISFGMMVGVVLEKITLNVMYIGVGIILGIYLLYLIKVVYVDNVNKNIRFSDEIDFNKPDKSLIQKNKDKELSKIILSQKKALTEVLKKKKIPLTSLSSSKFRASRTPANIQMIQDSKKLFREDSSKDIFYGRGRRNGAQGSESVSLSFQKYFTSSTTVATRRAITRGIKGIQDVDEKLSDYSNCHVWKFVDEKCICGNHGNRFTVDHYNGPVFEDNELWNLIAHLKRAGHKCTLFIVYFRILTQLLLNMY